MSAWKHIIWDWNGTLFNDSWLTLACINALLEKRGRSPLTPERYERIFTFPVINYYKTLGFDFDRESWEEVAAEFIDLYEKRRCECALQPDAVAALKESGKRGLSQSLLSAYKERTLREIVAFFHLEGFFLQVKGLNDHYARSKVESGKQLMAQLPCEPAEVVLVGDTVHDYDVAQAIGAACVLIPCGHQSREKLARCKAPLVDSLKEFLALLNENVSCS